MRASLTLPGLALPRHIRVRNSHQIQLHVVLTPTLLQQTDEYHEHTMRYDETIQALQRRSDDEPSSSAVLPALFSSWWPEVSYQLFSLTICASSRIYRPAISPLLWVDLPSLYRWSPFGALMYIHPTSASHEAQCRSATVWRPVLRRVSAALMQAEVGFDGRFVVVQAAGFAWRRGGWPWCAALGELGYAGCPPPDHGMRR